MTVKWYGGQVSAAAKAAALMALGEFAEDIMAASRPLVPLNKRDMVHRGTLQRSGNVERVSDGAILTYSVKEDVDYALEQHEHPEGPNWRHEAPGQWHFLSEPFKTLAGDDDAGGPTPRLMNSVQKAVRTRLRTLP